MRLIDADDLKQFEITMPRGDGYSDFVFAGHIHQAPTIDAVPIVRCKDCRWHIDKEPGMVYCLMTVGGWVEEDWFCKGGERKDDEQSKT